MRAPITSNTEVSKFTAISQSWWNPTGPFSQLHKINPPRLQFILNQLNDHYNLKLYKERPLNPLTILDIGCGGGLLCEPLHRLGASVMGIDAGAENIDVAKEHATNLGLEITYKAVLPEILAAQKIQFDVVLNMEVVEHADDVDFLLECSAQLVKPGGALIISTLNRTLKSLLLAKISAEYILRWLPIGTHDWQKFIKPSELNQKLNKHEMKIKKSSGVNYNIMQNNWELSSDLTVNYLTFSTKSLNCRASND